MTTPPRPAAARRGAGRRGACPPGAGRPASPPNSGRRGARLLAATLAALAALTTGTTGCGPPPELARPSPPPRLPSPTPSATPSPLPPSPTAAPASPSPSSPRFDEQSAVPCRGVLTGEAIVSVLRRTGVLPSGVAARVTRGPLCSGDWQYAVVTVADRDPLQVITEGQSSSLTLVAAGTQVCTAEVRVNAPPGIRTTAGCVG